MKIQTAAALNRCVSPPETLRPPRSKLKKKAPEICWTSTLVKNSVSKHLPGYTPHHHHCMNAQMLQSFVVVVSCSFPSELQFSQRSIKGDGKYTKYVA